MNKKQNKRNSIIGFVLLLVVIVLANVLSSFVFTRVDLTSEKRFTLSQATKDELASLQDIVYFKVYLSGDLPPGFQRLSTATRDMLNEMRQYAKGNLEYEFIDPSALEDEKQRTDLYKQLSERGLQPTNLQENETDRTSQRILFPGAIINYRAQEQALQLLKDRIGSSPEEMLNNSIQGLEYEVINAIRKVTTLEPKKIGFLRGQNELDKYRVADIVQTLNASYKVTGVTINQKLDALKDFDCVVIAKPDSAFDEKDKFIIDQYIMNGGKVLWLVDYMIADMDSLAKQNQFVSVANQLNVEDMLFRYGVRINTNLVLDLQSAPVPMLTGYVGNKPQTSFLPWFYFPLVIPTSKHPIVNNLNGIRFQFASSMDTLSNKEIAKTVLLQSSEYSRTVGSPAVIDLEQMKKKAETKQFNKGNQPLAVLLEGKFLSNYANRVPAAIANDSAIAFKETGVDNRMIVIADGDVIKNDYRKSNESIFPLGYDRYTGQFYGNKSFILNCIDYLCEGPRLMTLRQKEFRLRLLDKQRLEGNTLNIKIFNVIVPVILILVYAILRIYQRKRKYAA
ncbi:MAG TPA: gliding motility-associated ABC transporter substrate-binding protein GldG [Bacteroidia bacterium]|nr:gliding motility-associated ABC transporter substrate-binding protein GldG [Bacteroidia bacterium]HNU31987.1 gliding motility-associated ABC transporter substrate-binding protein GldG [Bacteroidia bacterium]